MADDKRNPKETPEWIPPSEAELAQLEALYGMQGPGADYTQGMGRFGDAWGMGLDAFNQEGGLDAIRKMMPKAGKYLAGAAKAGEAFKKSAMKETYRAGKLGMQALGSQMGGSGMLGSTLHGVSGLDIVERGGRAVSNIQAQAAGMKEAALQGRMGQVIGGLGQLGGIAAQQRQQSMMAAQGMGQAALGQAGLGLQSQAQQFGQGMGLLGVEHGYRREPMDFQMQQWLPYQQPGGGGLGPFIADVAGAYVNYQTGGMFGGGGGGGGGQAPPGYYQHPNYGGGPGFTGGY